MVEPLRHRQTKGAATDMLNLKPPRHTPTLPGYFLGKPDFAHALSGSDVGFAIPGVGAAVGRNLTPDKETGLGDWTADQIVTAFTTGVRPDGRKLAPVMPWMELANLTAEDAHAIAAYLK